jgi:hypothetical protein
MSEELSIKMDYDPSNPPTIEREIEVARRNLEERNLDGNSHAYWSGVFDGLTLAFNLMHKKDG